MMDRIVIRQIFFLILLSMAIIVLLGILLSLQVYGQDVSIREQEEQIIRDMEKKYLDSDRNDVLRFRGDAVIDEDEEIDGDVVLERGTLVVAGRVYGTILALFGDIELKSEAYVSGDVVCVDGKVWRQSGARVNGDVVETRTSQSTTTCCDEKRDQDKERDRRYKKINHGWLDHEEMFDFDGFYADYNRVDGLTVGLNLSQSDWWARRRHPMTLIGKVGYSFARKRIQYQAGLQRSFLSSFSFTLGGEYHDLTDTQDRWIMGDTENSLAAALIREDFRDYYRREGYSLFANQNLGWNISLRGEYRKDNFYNMENKTNWSLFGGKKEFRPNPAVLPYGYMDRDENEYMNIESFIGLLKVDTRQSRKDPHRGWYITAFAERGTVADVEDWTFERYIVDLRRYQPLSWDERLDIRLRAGSCSGLLPPMYWFDIGGISTLRGYRFKEFTGDRMVLANIDYWMNTHGSDWFILDDFNIIFFIDAGYAWFANQQSAETLGTWPVSDDVMYEAKHTKLEDEFEILTWSELKTNVGIGLASRNGDFRIDIAKSVKDNDRDLMVTLRLQRSF